MSTTPEPTDPPEPPADPAAPGDPAPVADPPLGAAGEKALAEWKQRAKDAEKLSREQAAALKAFEDAQKTEAEKLAERAEAAEQRAAKAAALAVARTIKAAASGRFADAQDAVDALAAADFLKDGEIDDDAIEAALAGLLERKPHWAAAAPSGPRIPAPDPAQGARPGAIPTLAQQIREAEEKGDVRLSIALKSRQLHEIQTARK